MARLKLDFYSRPAREVAPDLLGKHLVVRAKGKPEIICRIIETEAYESDDSASHSFGGETKRNKSMFLKGGHLYVYLSYGVHFCANVVTGAKGVGEAVLLRAADPIAGTGLMEERRGQSGRELLNGPGKLTQALGLNLKHDGMTLGKNEIFFADGDVSPSEIIVTERIGINKARDALLRFYCPALKTVEKSANDIASTNH
jgi:DNA-3-methyladenine glycosylase